MKRLLAICLLLWVGLGIHTASAAEAVTQDELNHVKELHQAKLDAAKELQQKDAEALRQQVAAVDKRVDDQLAQVGQAVDRYGVASAWIGIAITVLLVGFGLMGIRNAKAEAKEAATEEAKKAAKEQADESASQWFEQHAQELITRIATLEQRSSEVHRQMDDVSQRVHEKEASVTKAIEASQDRLNSIGRDATHSANTAQRNPQPTSKEQQDQRVLIQRSEELKKSGEGSYSFDDWNTRGHAAYETGNLEDAAYFWRKAAEVPNAPSENVAQALFNRGVTQGQLNQHEEAIASYGEVVRQFGEANEPELRERVAMALVNKGICQDQLNQSEAAIATFDEVVRRFGEASEPTLGEKVAMALNGSGFARLIQVKTLGLQNAVATKHLWSALDDFNQAATRLIQPSGTVLGNRAYVQQLLGNTLQAEADFFFALRAPDRGGQALYEATLKDLDMHPIPEDQAMRELVEQAWAAYQHEQGNEPKEPPATPPPH